MSVAHVAVLVDPLSAFDVVILHEGMALASGTTILRAVRTWGVECPAIIISGAMTGAAYDLAAADDRVRLLAKPHGVDALIQTLIELLGTRATG